MPAAGITPANAGTKYIKPLWPALGNLGNRRGQPTYAALTAARKASAW